MKLFVTTAAALCALATVQPAHAAPGDPVPAGGGFTFDPIIDARLRNEWVDTPTLDADAVTLRVRAGAEFKHRSGLSVLAEAEGTVVVVSDYNALPFVISDTQRRPGYAIVADPMNIELNRAQVQYKSSTVTLTVGRQRINLDDQRWVGAVGWRQNEQTFDAARAEAKLGPISFDGTYAIGQRTVFGVDAVSRTSYDGDYVFLGAGAKLGPVNLKAFSYLLDYDPSEQLGALAISNADTQTFGLRATASFRLSPKTMVNLAASYALQSDWRSNPVDYSAEYVAAEVGLSHGLLGFNAGFEQQGADNGRAVQTPMATLHKFNGWADLFLTTPAGGLKDWYGGAAIRLPGVTVLPGLNAAVTWHRFESDAGAIHYGSEWDASLGFKLGRVGLLAKYADYNADLFGADTRKLWLQLETGF